MNTFQEINTTLPAVLDLTSLGDHEYLVVSGAAEFLAGLGTRFGDIDIIVDPNTFKRLCGNMFQYEIKDFAGKECRIIRIGLVDIIECKDLDWFLAPRNKGVCFPILDDEHLIKWRIAIGRDKDQVRAWQMIHKFTPNSLQQIGMLEQRTPIHGDFHQVLHGFTNTLMEMA